MINGNATSFIDKLYYEDHYVIYDREKYFINGCQTSKSSDGKVASVRLEVYNLTRDTTVFSTIQATAIECINTFEIANIWNGKTFWNAEQEIEWVDD